MAPGKRTELIQLPEFQRRKPGHFFKAGYEMGGIGKAHSLCDILYAHSRKGQEEFLCLVNSVSGQIFIGRASQKTPEQPGEILVVTSFELFQSSV